MRWRSLRRAVQQQKCGIQKRTGCSAEGGELDVQRLPLATMGAHWDRAFHSIPLETRGEKKLRREDLSLCAQSRIRTLRDAPDSKTL